MASGERDCREKGKREDVGQRVGRGDAEQLRLENAGGEYRAGYTQQKTEDCEFHRLPEHQSDDARAISAERYAEAEFRGALQSRRGFAPNPGNESPQEECRRYRGQGLPFSTCALERIPCFPKWRSQKPALTRATVGSGGVAGSCESAALEQMTMVARKSFETPATPMSSGLPFVTTPSIPLS